MESKRIYQLDNAKLFLIFFVVLGHELAYFIGSNPYIPHIRLWIYLFHMPAFVFASGLVSKKTIRNSNWYKVIPFIFLFVLMRCLSFAVNYIRYDALGSFKDFITANGVSWFAICLFWWYAAAIITKKIKPVLILILSLVLSIGIGYIEFPGGLLAVRRAVVFFPFFYAGYLIDTNKLFSFLNRKPVKIVSACLLVLSLILVLWKYNSFQYVIQLSRGRYAYSEISDLPSIQFGGIYKLITVIISSCLSLCVFSVMPSKRVPVISSLGTKTLGVYVFHYFILYTFELIKPLYPWVNSAPICHSICFCIAVVLFCSLPIFDWPLRQLLNVFYIFKKKKTD